jgi:hypothetical protein
MKYKLRNVTSKYRRGTLSFLGRGAKISVDEKTKLEEKQAPAWMRIFNWKRSKHQRG